MPEPRVFGMFDVVEFYTWGINETTRERVEFTMTGPVVGFFRNKGFADHVVLNVKRGHAEGFPVNSCRHASDGAPLGDWEPVSAQLLRDVDEDFCALDVMDHEEWEEWRTRFNAILRGEIET